MKHLFFSLLLFCAIPVFAQTAEEFSAVERMANELAIELECDALKQKDFYIVDFKQEGAFELIKKQLRMLTQKAKTSSRFYPGKGIRTHKTFIAS